MDKKFDWNQARAFLTTVEEGSLTAAAHKLGLTQPTLSRQVAGLEADLDVVLFERIGRGLSLTSSGQSLFEHFSKMGKAADRATLVASGQSQEVEGNVSITASDMMTAYFLPQALVELAAIAPRITVELVASNEISDLQRREADIAIRHVRPDQPELIGKLLGHSKGSMYASPKYLAKVGGIKTVEDLKHVTLISYGDPERMVSHMNNMGLPFSIHQVRYASNNNIAGWEMIKAGLGVGVMSRLMGDATIEVERVLPDDTSMEFPTWLVTHQELNTAMRIRTVYDFLDKYIRTNVI
jgi:DNA-binding transcriptional LysR family regulator